MNYLPAWTEDYKARIKAENPRTKISIERHGDKLHIMVANLSHIGGLYRVQVMITDLDGN